MGSSKILSDLISSATATKAHFEIWWALESEAKPMLVPTMQEHSDFFLAASRAHHAAFFVSLARLYDTRSDSSSISTYLKAIENTIDTSVLATLRADLEVLTTRAQPLLVVRHKTIAHVDVRLSESDVLAPLDITWNEVREVIYDSAIFVTKLAGISSPGTIGNFRDGRLIEATLKLIVALRPSSL
jgi:hypothetical protein